MKNVRSKNRPTPIVERAEASRTRSFRMAQNSYIIVFVSLLLDFVATTTGQAIYLLLSGLAMMGAWWLSQRGFVQLDKARKL